MNKPARNGEEQFRHIMANFPTGVAIVTAKANGRMCGMTVNSFTSVSLHPCTVLVCLEHGKSTTAAVQAGRAFAVHLMREDQQDLSMRFAGSGEDKFSGLELLPNVLDTPLIEGCLAHLVCEVAQIYAEGDHDIVIGRVKACSDVSGEPLAYCRGGFATLS